MQNLKHIIFGTFLGLTLFIPTLVLAQATTTAPTSGVSGATEYKGVDAGIASYLCAPSDSVTDNSQDLPNCINKVYRFSIAFGAIALVFFVVYAGYLYMIGGETGKASAKTMIQNAIIGISLLLGSYVILTFINPNLVIYKPIQAPLFTANDFPSCEEIGYTDSCTIDQESGNTNTDGMTRGTAAPCKGGLISIPSEIPHSGKVTQICKDLSDKLLQLVKILPPKGDNAWIISQTFSASTPSKSRCHHVLGWVSPTGIKTTETGNCADFNMVGQTPGKSPSDKSYANLCKAIKQIGGLNYLNEASTEAECGPFDSEVKRTGSNLHVNYIGSSGGGGSSSSAGGTRPNCIPVAKTPGVCDDNLSSGSKAPDDDFQNADPGVKVAFDTLKKQYKNLNAKQVYRSPEYGAHMRSSFEAYAFNQGWTESQIRSYGQYCASQNILYVTAADAKNSNTITYGKKHFNDHFASKNLDPLEAPMTCYSDHGRGLAVDIEQTSTTQTKAFEQAARAAGLCHNVPQFTAHGHTTRKDYPHYVLFSKFPQKEKICINYY